MAARTHARADLSDDFLEGRGHGNGRLRSLVLKLTYLDNAYDPLIRRVGPPGWRAIKRAPQRREEQVDSSSYLSHMVRIARTMQVSAAPTPCSFQLVFLDRFLYRFQFPGKTVSDLGPGLYTVMLPYKSQRRVHIDDPQSPYDASRNGTVEDDDDGAGAGAQHDGGMRVRPSDGSVSEDQEPFMGVKVRRKTSLHREYKGDYIDVPSHPFLMKILQKQGWSTCFQYASSPLYFQLHLLWLGQA